MSAPLTVLSYPDADALADAIAARLITTLTDHAAAGGPGAQADVVLTGGGIGTGCLQALATRPDRDSVDWSGVQFWWGDERFVAADDADRNDRAARMALLDALPITAGQVHPMGSSDDYPDAETAAAAYAAELATRAADHVQDGSARAGSGVPPFTVLMLGIGPEGHVASIFPDSPAARASGSVVAVHDSPKPPPTRISLTFAALRSAQEVWILASGSSKTEAVAQLVAGAAPLALPAAGAVGTVRTLLLADIDALADVPVR